MSSPEHDLAMSQELSHFVCPNCEALIDSHLQMISADHQGIQDDDVGICVRCAIFYVYTDNLSRLRRVEDYEMAIIERDDPALRLIMQLVQERVKQHWKGR